MAASIPIINTARCSGCGRCIAACHLRLFAFERQGWRKISVLQDMDRCTGCAQCNAMCPIDAISMEKKQHTMSKVSIARSYECAMAPHCPAAHDQPETGVHDR